MLPFNGHQSCWVITAIHKVYALLHWASPGATCAHFAGAGVGVEGGGAAMTPLCVKLTTSAWGHMPLAPKCVIFYAAFCVAHSTDRHREGDSKRERDREREKEREIDSEADSDICRQYLGAGHFRAYCQRLASCQKGSTTRAWRCRQRKKGRGEEGEW